MTPAFWYPFLTLRVRLRAWRDARRDAKNAQWFEGYSAGFKEGRRSRDPIATTCPRHPINHALVRDSLEHLIGGRQ